MTTSLDKALDTIAKLKAEIARLKQENEQPESIRLMFEGRIQNLYAEIKRLEQENAELQAALRNRAE